MLVHPFYQCRPVSGWIVTAACQDILAWLCVGVSLCVWSVTRYGCVIIRVSVRRNMCGTCMYVCMALSVGLHWDDM